MKECENCGSTHEGKYASGRFCSIKCSKSFSTSLNSSERSRKISNSIKSKGIKTSKEVKEKIRESLKKWNCENPREKISEETSEKFRKRNIERRGKTKLKTCKVCNNEKLILITSKICSECKEPMRAYKESCSFKFNIFDYPDIFDLTLLEKYGWYSPKNSKNPNLNGISRDHKISIYYGFKYSIDPFIISHPLNCELLKHTDNQKKNRNCSISVEKIISEINLYEKNKM
jgi:hypothetical protein